MDQMPDKPPRPRQAPGRAPRRIITRRASVPCGMPEPAVTTDAMMSFRNL